MLHDNKNGTHTMRVACAIFFLLFSFIYLYYYQADILVVTQHVLSHGATHYNPTIGAILITLVLWAIQLGLYALTGLTRRAHALTYLPSLLLLGIITSAGADIAPDNYLGNWLWGFPLLMIMYAALVWLTKQLEPMEPDVTSIGLFSRLTWINFTELIAMMLITCTIGCSDSVLHYRAKIENCLINGKYAEAAQVGADDEKTDSCLSLLRITVLAKQGQLPERLFDYSLVGGSKVMSLKDKSLIVPKYKFTKVEKSADWKLCALLLDRKLDAFASKMVHYNRRDSLTNSVIDSLPKSYREALVLYTHSRRNPVITYHNPEMDADYDDFIATKRKTKNEQEKYSLLKNDYQHTYWFYYLYRK